MRDTLRLKVDSDVDVSIACDSREDTEYTMDFLRRLRAESDMESFTQSISENLPAILYRTSIITPHVIKKRSEVLLSLV